MTFTPTVPVDLLVPLVWGVVLVCFGLFSLVVLRRLWIIWRGRAEDALADRIETALLRFLAGAVAPEGFGAWLARPERKHLHALVRAVARVETAGHADVRERIRAAGLPEALARVLGGEHAATVRGWSRIRPADRWTRAAAARALGHLGMAEGIPALARALDDPEADVAYAAAGALAALDIPEAAAAILRRIGKGSTLNNARLAALVAPMRCDVAGAILETLRRDDTVAAFWALELIGQRRLYDSVEEVRPFLTSPDANARTAATECLGRLAVPLTDRWIAPLLSDDAWFVRSHAARALGALHAAWASREIAALLVDREWWVRHNAAEALVEIGRADPDAGRSAATEPAEAAEGILFASDDAFARLSAIDVLERLGWLDERIERAAGGDRRARAAVETFVRAGGIGHVENALGTASEAALPLVIDLLAECGDAATVGRIRACLARIPEPLRARALEVADALRGA